MKSATPVMIDVLLVIRSASSELLANGGILDALRRQGVDVHRTHVMREGVTILCKGDVSTLCRCAEHVASLSFVSGLSMQRCDDSA